MLLLQVLATCDEYDVRLTGELYAQLLKTQLLLSHASDSSKTGGQLDDVLHALTCLKEAEGNEWALLLQPGDRLALCVVLNKHMQHAVLLQTVWPWHSKVCVHLLTSGLLHHLTVSRQSQVLTAQPDAVGNRDVCSLFLAYVVWCWRKLCHTVVALQPSQVKGKIKRLLFLLVFNVLCHIL